jgi:hypothetical protein
MFMTISDDPEVEFYHASGWKEVGATKPRAAGRRLGVPERSRRALQ